jgi:hypothetical protein
MNSFQIGDSHEHSNLHRFFFLRTLNHHYISTFFLLKKKKKRGNKESLDVIKLKVITTKGIRKSAHNNIKQGTWISGLVVRSHLGLLFF